MKWLLPAPLQISFLHFYPTRLGTTPQLSILLQLSYNITISHPPIKLLLYQINYKVSISFFFSNKGIKKESKKKKRWFLNFFLTL
jgi:hypothetical protein